MQRSICWRVFLIFVSVITVSGITLAGDSKNKANTVNEGKYSIAEIDDDHAVEIFVKAIKQAVAKDQHAEVAAMISYPIIVTLIDGNKMKITNVLSFVKS